MKYLVAVMALSVAFGCSPTYESDSPQVSDLVMPVSEHPDLSAVELVLEIDDTSNPPAAVPDVVAQTLKELGVVQKTVGAGRNLVL